MKAVVAGAIVLGACSVFASPAAGAASTVSALQSGYWWQAEASGSPLPPPPQVPPGGLWVSSEPAGPQSVSALRFSVAPGASATTLTLKVDQAQPTSQIAVVACPASGPWVVPKGPGSWASRPGAACGRGRVAGHLDTARGELTFQLGSLGIGLGAGRVVDVVLVPAPPSGPSANVGYPTFDATFEPVVGGEIGTAPTPAAPPPAPGPAPGPALAPAPAGHPAAAAPSASGATPPATAAAPPTGAAPVEVPSAATATGAAPSLSPVPAGASSGPAPALAQPSSQGPAIGESVTSALPRALGLPVRSWRNRLLLSFMLVDIVAYAIVDARKRSDRRGRPLLSLYGPPPSQRLRTAVSTGAVRTGRPPPLR